MACIVTCLMVKSWLPGLWKKPKNVGLHPKRLCFVGQGERRSSKPRPEVGVQEKGRPGKQRGQTLLQWVNPAGQNVRTQLETQEHKLGSTQDSRLQNLRG